MPMQHRIYLMNAATANEQIRRTLQERDGG